MAEQRIATSKVAGTWAWFFQRLSAVLLVILLAAHIIAAHYWHVGEEISVNTVNERLHNVAFIAIDYSMLAMVLFHGLNGTRTILFDFDKFIKRRKAVDIGLWILGIATMAWGIVILWPFITG
jgi:succinate dehydrogenase / fumarate reductase membrane anchor subunit